MDNHGWLLLVEQVEFVECTEEAHFRHSTFLCCAGGQGPRKGVDECTWEMVIKLQCRLAVGCTIAALSQKWRVLSKLMNLSQVLNTSRNCNTRAESALRQVSEGFLKLEHRENGAVDYRMNLLGIRVSNGSAQAIAKDRGDWTTLGPVHYLPIQVPSNTVELKAASNDTLLLTAYQYQAEHPDSDLRKVLAQQVDDSRADKPITAGSAL